MTHWTTEKPTVEGPYWYYCANGETGLVELVDYQGGLVCDETTNPVESITELWNITHWCGPLVPPEPPKERK